jgi:tripartite-type tricarboxylate transporter receptor subunit TctC
MSSLRQSIITSFRGGLTPALRCFAIASLVAGTAAAQPYPSKPVRLIIPSSPGSGVDFVSRTVAPPLSTELGQQVVTDNRAGAGGLVGAELAAKAPPNGYTLIMATPSQVINAHLHKNMSANLLGEFVPISLATSGQFVLIVNPSVPAKTLSAFIALAKSKPGELRYGSAGQGNITHLAGELFKNAAAVDLLHVPYKGSGPALVDLLGGQIHAMFANMAAGLPHIRSGKVHAIASTGPKRAAVTADLPTIAELGVRYEVTGWFGLLAPKGTPREIVAKLNSAMVKVLRSQETSERLNRESLDVVASTSAQFATHLDAEGKRWARAIEISGAKAN